MRQIIEITPVKITFLPSDIHQLSSVEKWTLDYSQADYVTSQLVIFISFYKHCCFVCVLSGCYYISYQREAFCCWRVEKFVREADWRHSFISTCGTATMHWTLYNFFFEKISEKHFFAKTGGFKMANQNKCQARLKFQCWKLFV